MRIRVSRRSSTPSRNTRRLAAGFLLGAVALGTVSLGTLGCRPAAEPEPNESELAVAPPEVDVDDSEPTPIRLEADAAQPTAEAVANNPPASSAPASSTPASSTPAAPAGDRATGDEIVGGGSAPEDWRKWPKPEGVLVISGQQHGYIEPCGCTGLKNQKGGLARRATLLKQIRELGWETIPVDAGNQVRRSGRQAAIKFQTTVKGLAELDYKAIGFGPDDLRLGASELLSVAAADEDNPSRFASANVELLAPELVPLVQQTEAGGRQIGVTTALHPETLDSPVDDAILIGELHARLSETLTQLREEGSEFNVLLLFGDAKAAQQVAREVPGYDLIVAAATYGEPTYQAERIEGTDSRLVLTGDKGMYVGLVGLYDGQLRYARVALDSQFEDAPEMLQLMAEYQEQLKALGLEGLQVRPIAHPSGRKYVGTETCGECHTTAYEIWQGTPHAEATEDIVHPGERSEIPRHFDPECLSCHVTGWNPQSYYPYESGYLSLEETPLMTGSGCENCHGPGSAHVAAERGETDATSEMIAELRESMRLPLEDAREKCMECHDLDNSPDFHQPGAFDEYWSQIEHYGLD
ncbi:multiheme c-type cytochrome [Candidatus Laterigemmans baculatus]|uniref:multiheme c-type cytochrome n=1 Tax=Candidatus Laterigemmans baculatus TaxID=2770505 RepID=UPI0013D99BE0|nr:multiheme c-type cytochrome [Candidatus Laterigemmans baculatus]